MWCYAEGTVSREKDFTVFMGTRTTAYARLVLFDNLVKLQRPVLTDLNHQVGFWLDLNDELNDGTTHQGKPRVTCKGMTLNALNF